MTTVYAREHIHGTRPSIFMAGPSPRGNIAYAWRPEAMGLLGKMGFTGVIYNPECRDEYRGRGTEYSAAWEDEAFKVSDVILFWVPRNMEHMIGLTTNVEFGLYANDSRSVYGRPDQAPHIAYLDFVWNKFSRGEIYRSLEDTVRAALSKFNKEKT